MKVLTRVGHGVAALSERLPNGIDHGVGGVERSGRGHRIQSSRTSLQRLLLLSSYLGEIRPRSVVVGRVRHRGQRRRQPPLPASPSHASTRLLKAWSVSWTAPSASSPPSFCRPPACPPPPSVPGRHLSRPRSRQLLTATRTSSRTPRRGRRHRRTLLPLRRFDGRAPSMVADIRKRAG